MPDITLEKVGTLLKEMKTGKACGLDQIEGSKLLGEEGLDYPLQTMKECLNHEECVKYRLRTKGKALCWNVEIIEKSSRGLVSWGFFLLIFSTFSSNTLLNFSNSFSTSTLDSANT